MMTQAKKIKRLLLKDFQAFREEVRRASRMSPDQTNKALGIKGHTKPVKGMRYQSAFYLREHKSKLQRQESE